MDVDFSGFIKLLAAFQALLLALFLLTNKHASRSGNYFIALFLTLMSLNITSSFIDRYLTTISPNLVVFLATTAYLIAPALFLYIKSSLLARFKLTWKEGVHLLPFVLINLIIIPDIYLENLKELPVESDNIKLLGLAAYLFFYVQILTYILLSYRILWVIRQLYIENFSNTDLRRYDYLFKLNTIFTVVCVFSAIKNLVLSNIGGAFFEYAIHIVLFSLLVFFCWIIYMGLQAPELFRKADPNLPLVKEMIKESRLHKSKDEASQNLLTDAEETPLMLEEVKKFMEDKEPYLDASLSLNDLARQTMKPARELSILINHHLNKHFFDFVNEYRIEKAMQMLKDPEKKALTILEVLYDVGFNSKSSFNTAFKKHTGYTPSQYRKTNLISGI